MVFLLLFPLQIVRHAPNEKLKNDKGREEKKREQAKMFFRTIFHCCNLSFNSINVVWDMLFSFIFATSKARKGTLKLNCLQNVLKLIINSFSKVMWKGGRDMTGSTDMWRISDVLRWKKLQNFMSLSLIGFVLQQGKETWTLPALQKFRNFKLILAGWDVQWKETWVVHA